MIKMHGEAKPLERAILNGSGWNLDSKKAFIIHFDVFFIANPIGIHL